MVIISLVIVSGNVYPQFAITKSMSDRMEGKLKKEVLDQAAIRCWYEFTQYCVNERVKEQVTDTFILDIGPKYSVYYDRNRFVRDSIYMVEGEKRKSSIKLIKVGYTKDEVENLQKQGGFYKESPSKGETCKLYKNKKRQEIILIDGNNMGMYKCTEKIPIQSWELKNDTMTVLGYVCQKAETLFRGRNYEAWFASDIPMQDGPWKLYGLPGMILKVDVDNGLFTFQAIGIEHISNCAITMDKDQYTKADRQQLKTLEFKKIYKRFHFGDDGVATKGFSKDERVFDDLELD